MVVKNRKHFKGKVRWGTPNVCSVASETCCLPATDPAAEPAAPYDGNCSSGPGPQHSLQATSEVCDMLCGFVAGSLVGGTLRPCAPSQCLAQKSSWAARQGQKLSRSNFYPVATRCLTGPSGYGMAGGMELQFFGLWIFNFRSLKFGKNRSFCGISRIFLQNSASEKYFSDSGKLPFHAPPIHTPTKCRPNLSLDQEWLRQTKPNKVKFAKFRGRTPELVPEPPFACKFYTKPLKKGVPELSPDPFPESSRTSLCSIWFAGATPDLNL